MAALIRRIFSYKFLPLCWTILIIILLCLPGSMVPGTGIFSLPHLDKYIHIILFGTHVLLWGWHYAIAARLVSVQRQNYMIVVMLTIALGVALEFIQGSGLVSHRSFDVYDILADTIGAFAGGLWLIFGLQRKTA